MPYSLESYLGYGVDVVTPDPAGLGGAAINKNFKALQTRIVDEDPDSDAGSAVGIGVGSRWFNESTGIEWLCMDDTEGSAVWVKISAGTSGYEMPDGTKASPGLHFQAAATVGLYRSSGTNGALNIVGPAGTATWGQEGVVLDTQATYNGGSAVVFKNNGTSFAEWIPNGNNLQIGLGAASVAANSVVLMFANKTRTEGAGRLEFRGEVVNCNVSQTWTKTLMCQREGDANVSAQFGSHPFLLQSSLYGTSGQRPHYSTIQVKPGDDPYTARMAFSMRDTANVDQEILSIVNRTAITSARMGLNVTYPRATFHMLGDMWIGDPTISSIIPGLRIAADGMTGAYATPMTLTTSAEEYQEAPLLKIVGGIGGFTDDGEGPVGGSVAVLGGDGSAGVSEGDGGNGGDVYLTGGVGGAGTSGFEDGASGSVRLQGRGDDTTPVDVLTVGNGGVDVTSVSVGKVALTLRQRASQTEEMFQALDSAAARVFSLSKECVPTFANSVNPASPSSGEARIYVRGNKLVIQTNNGGTVKYVTLSFPTSDGTVTWSSSGTAP
jgi:hypothetical protein